MITFKQFLVEGTEPLGARLKTVAEKLVKRLREASHQKIGVKVRFFHRPDHLIGDLTVDSEQDLHHGDLNRLHKIAATYLRKQFSVGRVSTNEIPHNEEGRRKHTWDLTTIDPEIVTQLAKLKMISSGVKG